MITLTSFLKNAPRIGAVSSRMYCIKSPEPIQYPGFKYYPRHENFKDPPYEPSKLFLVTRIKSMKGRTPEERKSLEHLNLDGERHYNGHIAVLKNIPETNATLWKIKHLVEIKPIFWKGELPKDGDFTGAYLRETGELVLSPKLKCSNTTLEATQQYNGDTSWPRAKYLKKHLLEQWKDPMKIAV